MPTALFGNFVLSLHSKGGRRTSVQNKINVTHAGLLPGYSLPWEVTEKGGQTAFHSSRVTKATETAGMSSDKSIQRHAGTQKHSFAKPGLSTTECDT